MVVIYRERPGSRAFVDTPPAADGGWSRRTARTCRTTPRFRWSAPTRPQRTRAFLSVTSFLAPTPRCGWRTPRTVHLAQVKSLLPKFDASKDAVDQYEATSKDGTRIPYFVVHPKDMALNGANPTMLYAYGGFQVSMTPSYSGVNGKLWLERGGVYVLANIRGGGEFGPAWHDAGLKTHRQLIYDDFRAAVARGPDRPQDHQSPAGLGIQGGSNGLACF